MAVTHGWLRFWPGRVSHGPFGNMTFKMPNGPWCVYGDLYLCDLW